MQYIPLLVIRIYGRIAPHYMIMPFVKCCKALIIVNMSPFNLNAGPGNKRIIMDMIFYVLYISRKIMGMTIKIRIFA